MDFQLTEEQRLLQQNAREFAQEYCQPIAAEIDQTGRYPAETIKQMAAHDFMGMPYPEEYGGAGTDYVSYILAVEEISRVCASTGIIYSAHCSLGLWPIYKWGSEELKKKYLVPLCKGEKLGAFALTEPGAGTDAASGTCTATLENDSYVLNGTKCFITNGGVADVYLVFALTDPTKGVKGLSAFVVEKDLPGFEIGKHEDKMGIRGSQTTELIFKNCRVPKGNLIGEEGKGFKYAMQTLDGGRVGVAAQALGIAQGALDEAIKFAKERVQFGKPIATKQAIQWMLADMETHIQAARFLVYNAAAAKDRGEAFSKEAAMAKLFAAETADYVCTKAIQVHGGYGYIKQFKVERCYRDAKICSIYEGTSEVQRMVIAGALLR
ncbi:acyl-CoA dehydrogenase [Sporomusa acidovorans]|uniref:Acyl-CoA dehydrogenase, short-chain specific n=1 Tax=Sporomusa acidovorans (strain ATCC 49682 / DSM 3132 / Mol) TaxID=1123286 RepID=A0ABZ3IZ25_SPOA4|nr:acyl-CoA dehydrogenase [Sporomusa acidovorans]OZC16833.1 acyl-CoA dehydrogenase [Sporomusa acidovorans DSM 3132]SDF23792.1 butyryl-CoA dehydrogenase [Sporomusa acidovorans]